MTAAVATRSGALGINPSLIVISFFAILIAWVGPFDIPVNIATFGQPALRVALILAMISVGAFCAHKTGLHIEGVGAARPLVVGAAAAFLTAVYIALIDGFLFRSIAPQYYVQFIHGIGLSQRLTYYFMRAYQESVIYRLFLFSALIYGLTIWRGGRSLPAWQLVSAMIGVQALNVLLNTVAPEPISLQILAYDGARYLVPGSVWGWLYWRFGFATLEVAHAGSHVFLQPALGVLI